MNIAEIRATELFVATHDGDAQVLVVALDEVDPTVAVTVHLADSVVGSAPADSAEVEVALVGLIGRPVGEVHDVRVEVGNDTRQAQIVVAEPGWTVWMIPHFHYDPVFWNTQAAYTATWDELAGEAQRMRIAFQQTGFALVDAHLDAARLDPDYKFVLSEVDYLKPYWDARPAQRAYIRRLLAEGRLEIMGGAYNEPDTNLTSAETTIRNLIYGAGFQREVVQAEPQTAWQLDAFGHHPQFPGLAADAGLTSSSWARGPHHQWGPMLTAPYPTDNGWGDPLMVRGDPTIMQFPTEFEWISPSGRGVLTHYMPAHYSAGWHIDSRTTLADAEAAVFELFRLLKRVAATRNVLLPVGTDYTPPAKWITEIQRDWNARYAWPRFECAIPREFFAAVRSELDERAQRPAPQTRDMNPIYTGTDVSYIDTKQAQRAAEVLLVEAEMFAAFASLRGAQYPHAALDKAWRQLVYGAHHDGITGSESDQVYLDLLTGWREAHDIGRTVLGAALDHLAAQLEMSDRDGTPVTVFNPSAWDRTDLVSVDVTLPPGARGLQVVAPGGSTVPIAVENSITDQHGTLIAAQVTFLAEASAVGRNGGWTVRATDQETQGWTVGSGTCIESDRYVIEVDPARGGCVSRLFDKRAQREVIRSNGFGNELIIQHEYPEHPQFREGPWHLLPTGRTVRRSSTAPADGVSVEHSALGQRITLHGRLGAVRYTQRITLWNGLDRVDCRTTLDDFSGADELVRVLWAADVPGALPVSDVGCAVVGRGFAFPDTDVAEHPWTLDNPAASWFALSSTARVRVGPHNNGAAFERAIGVAELVASRQSAAGELRDLVVALAGQGVTATTSVAGGTRYGNLAVDSNLPDFRIAIGGPAENSFTAAVLNAADQQYRVEVDKQISATGRARIWVPARRPLRELWRPGANLTDTLDLPVLIIVGAEEVAAVAADLVDAVIEVPQVADATTDGESPLDDYTVALMNTGMPSFNIDTGGALSMSLMRSSTGWPSGVWIDPPRRTAPDGSNFQQQHWTHHFDYTLVSGAGDWRRTGLVRAGHELNHPLRTSQQPPSGSQPGTETYLSIHSTSDVLLNAVKASGNPLAAGKAPHSIESLAIRLVEGQGATTDCAVSWPLANGDATFLDLLERPVDDPPLRTAGGTVGTELTPMQIRTIGLPVRGPAGQVPLGADHEPWQPVYSRYWLNNTGPAPRGGLPVGVHTEPSMIAWSPDTELELTLTIFSDRTDDPVNVQVEIVVPSGWRTLPATFEEHIAPGHFVTRAVRVIPCVDLAPGSWWVRAQASIDGQLVEDVTRIVVGTQAGPELTASLLGPGPLAPGESGAIELTLSNHARTSISSQVQLISPWHTWDLLPSWNTGVELAPRERVTLHSPVHVPPSAPPGSWWLLAKLATAGVIQYTEPIELVVRRP